MNILIIEDEPAVRAQIRTVLEEEEYQITLADTISSAHQKLDKNLSDAVIMDLELCEGSSFDSCQDLLKQQSSVPFLILSLEMIRKLKLNA